MALTQDEVIPGPRRRLSMVDIGRRLHRERKKQALTLTQLAERSGTSKSMISAIERGEKAPSVLVLDQVANALGISVSRLIAPETTRPVVMLRKHEQKVFEEANAERAVPGFHRRVTSPVVEGVDFEMGRLEIAPFVDAGVYSPHLSGWAEYVVVERGELEIGLDGQPHLLATGDALYFASDCEHSYRNPGPETCVAYLVMVDQPHPTTRHVHPGPALKRSAER